MDSIVTTALLWLWLGFSLAFVTLVGLVHSSKHYESKVQGDAVATRMTLPLRLLIAFMIGIGAFASASIWPLFRQLDLWAAVALWSGIAVAAGAAFCLYRRPKA